MISRQNIILFLFASLALYQFASAYDVVYGRQFGWTGGKKGGFAFDDGIGAKSDEILVRLCIRSAARVDQVSFITTTRTLIHGGYGGSEQCWFLPEIVAYNVCWGSAKGSVRVFRLEFETLDGNKLGGGKKTNSCARYVLPKGGKVVGMVGRSGSEIDTFGLSFFV